MNFSIKNINQSILL